MVFLKLSANPVKYSQDNRTLETSPEKHPYKEMGSFSLEKIRRHTATLKVLTDHLVKERVAFCVVAKATMSLS